ncbi:MAG: polysaccharide deacetylase family protein [Peptococcaceae bacterium]|nr:polysaccharide deacetylase family protein [Peptococcaceae bacterium]
MLKQNRRLLIAVSLIIAVIGGLFAWKPLLQAPVAGSGEKQAGNTAEAREASPEEIRQAARAVGANELGQVPIFVYHLIGEEEGRWTRTPDNLRKDLQELYDRNYVLIPLNDYLAGNIDIPAGKSPAVITFDDGTAGQFRLLEKENGETAVDPDCAVAILRDFAEKHPGFGHAATFFINAEPFGQPPYWQKKLQMLREWGFEIGNHTYGHKYLKGLPPEQAADQIARLQEHIQQALPGYVPKAFAIVQDGLPEPLDVALSGESGGVKYRHEGILWWAWSAAPSPYHKDFDRTRVQRIQVFQDNGRSSLVNWLERISPARYVSDGLKGAVSVPENWREKVKDTGDKKLVVYPKDGPLFTPGKEKASSEARGVHVSFMYASSPDRWNRLLEMVERAGLNTVQLDVKDESGRIGYDSGVKTAGEIGSDLEMLPIRDMLAGLKKRGIYSIARIVVFRDPVMAAMKPEHMVRKADGTPLAGGVWVDPYSREIWDYNVDLALEAFELGFDEVQFDYIRFPEGSEARSAIYGSKGNDSRHRVDVIAGFLNYARSKAGWERTISATLFGFMSSAADDQGIGQRAERMAPFTDYLSPMVYPSHYGPGNYGFANPNAHPYEVVNRSLKEFQPLVESTGCRLRPWLQAFTWGPPPYGRNEIRAQIKAAEDNSINTWLLWDPRVDYRAEEISALKTPGRKD